MPARRRIGALAYSAYAEAADLGNGVAFYATLGVAAALLSVVAPAAAWRLESESVRLPAILAAAFAVLHSAVTVRAAPTLFGVRDARADETHLARILDRFAGLQALRCTLQLANFAVLLWLWVVVSTAVHHSA